jgi:hypothetical protein
MRKKCKILPLFLSLLLMSSFLFPKFIFTGIAEEVSIAWNPNSESDLDGYSVYWSSSFSGPPYELLAKLFLDELADQDNPEFTLPRMQNGKKYYIVVTTFDKAGNESTYSKEICVKIEDNSIVECTPPGDSVGSGSM